MIFPTKFNVTSLNGKNGFAFTNNLTESWFGWSVSSLGDINKDAKSDLIVTAQNIGQAYVLFGASSFPSEVHTSSLNGKNGFLIIAEGFYTPGCATKGIGDVNKDGINDFIVGQCGMNKAYVVFGAKTFPPRLSLANIGGKDGFIVTGASFTTAAGIGDFNGDGAPDFLMGSSDSNSAFVIYGASSFPTTVDVSRLNGSNGFGVVGPFNSKFGISLDGTGDFNGDSMADIIIGMWQVNQAAVIFGAHSFPYVFGTSSLNGSNGFIINGPSLFGGNQQSVAGVGDINGDHLTDLGIGCIGSGEAFLVFGARYFNVTFDVSNLDGRNGVKLIGPPAGPQGSAFGDSIASGACSINNNGKSGVILGAMQTGDNEATGSAYVFFGSNHFPPTLHATDLNGTNGFEIVGNIDAALGSYVSCMNNFLGDDKPSIVVGAVLESKVYVILDASIL